jgi:hypothetical protein
MVAVATPVEITVPGTHRITFVSAIILDQKLSVEYLILIKKETIFFTEPGSRQDDLVKKSPGILVGQRADSLSVKFVPGVKE